MNSASPTTSATEPTAEGLLAARHTCYDVRPCLRRFVDERHHAPSGYAPAGIVFAFFDFSPGGKPTGRTRDIVVYGVYVKTGGLDIRYHRFGSIYDLGATAHVIRPRHASGDLLEDVTADPRQRHYANMQFYERAGGRHLTYSMFAYTTALMLLGDLYVEGGLGRPLYLSGERVTYGLKPSGKTDDYEYKIKGGRKTMFGLKIDRPFGASYETLAVAPPQEYPALAKGADCPPVWEPKGSITAVLAGMAQPFAPPSDEEWANFYGKFLRAHEEDEG